MLVGAMRPATAIERRRSAQSAERGPRRDQPMRRAARACLIVLNDEINAARDTTKTNTLRVETFRAPELGILGYIDEDKVSYYRANTKRHTLELRVRRHER